MKLYHFNQETKEYTGQSSDCRYDPLTGAAMQPKGSTFLEPPIPAEKTAIVFVGNEYTDGKWEVADDFRGTYYSTKTKEPVVISSIGVKQPEDTTDKEPGQHDRWDGKEWVFDVDGYVASVSGIYLQGLKDAVLGEFISGDGQMQEILDKAREKFKVMHKELLSKKTKEEIDEYISRR